MLAVLLGATVELSQAMVNMVDLYLRPEFAAHRAKIAQLAKAGDAKSEAALEGYAREALRMCLLFIWERYCHIDDDFSTRVMQDLTRPSLVYCVRVYSSSLAHILTLDLRY